jgi:serine/threonine protein phosphatase 1
MSEKLFAVGDIHGCLYKLYSLYGRIEFDPKRDRIVFLGDYIDRGPWSFGVIEFLLKLKRDCPKAVFLKGNHEEMLEDYLSGKDRKTFMANGGDRTIQSYRENALKGQESVFPEKHLEFFRSLLPYYETDRFIFVHAGLREGVELRNQHTHDLLWSRGSFIYSDYDFGKIVVFGHTPFSEPYITRNRIGIDTGAVYGNKLTGVELNALEFFSV